MFTSRAGQKIRGEMKAAALVGGTFDPDSATHRLDNSRGDGQSEPGPAEFPSCRRIGLLERGEDMLLFVVWNADPRITHSELQCDLGFLAAPVMNIDNHLTRLGKLNRVSHEIDEHLSQPPRITAQIPGNVSIDVPRQPEVFCMGA
jgi:hypothetical protein